MAGVTTPATGTDLPPRRSSSPVGSPATVNAVLRVDSVTKRFGERLALDDVSFEVPEGGLTGFVGANGSGKTTTMRIILGVLEADAGTVSMDGRDLGTADRRRFGYMPEERGLYPKMKVAEQITYLGRLHGMSTKSASDSAADLLERLGLTDRAGDTVESLSLGNQQRAQIAAALVHSPTVLVLDEPFSGLDPLAVETVVGVLKDFAASGAPVLFSSHQLDIVERLCDHLVIIAGGVVRASGGRQQLQREHDPHRYELVAHSDVGWVRGIAGIRVVDFDGDVVTFETTDADAAQRVLREALARGGVTRFTDIHPTLSQIFQEVIR